MNTPLIAAAVIGYLSGSVPYGLLLTRAAGLGDIRSIGSGNIGATNVLRTGNKKVAVGTLLLDALKGAVPVLAFTALWGRDAGLLAGIAALLGHVFPVWLRFKGGKGVATGAGILLAASWWIGLLCALIWVAMAKITRISSASALTACVAAPVIALLAGDRLLAGFALVVALIILWRHADNIRRLLAGTEPRIGKGK
ncbi:glycerol-3-phosphate 1-O-acyltransferase PlsY [Pseudoroseomonas ludipueritiae]|uniref:Glycerol-3-phosphate acyltransferase n=1 Tax=Pseudoroseomonas ludipueritiae TaxID=198093 RepID=A0ABR7R468_9PROT|nr:glycerol-3-phosphate 1-O-acyltransferase PlsY [Pseudoroseomonas ludipueritiae]MBC9176513.1 glycerol-3-phosphate 1-O-acyltransferase PlsY [Pseudoroseomonas ludipueritiae]MCG7361977.1 glycerol-3-phosphate 1-O-acyltransferase PlsY [Roseomonas sp. ACRSG]